MVSGYRLCDRAMARNTQHALGRIQKKKTAEVFDKAKNSHKFPVVYNLGTTNTHTQRAHQPFHYYFVFGEN